MTNTNATTSWRAKWLTTYLQKVLTSSLVAEKICDVDRSDSYYIWNPYQSTPTVVTQAIIGTYVVATYGTTNDTLTVEDEFIVSEHIYDFEKVMANYDLFAQRAETMTVCVAQAIDKYIINHLTEDCSGTYDTPSGGFTTPANIPKIMGDLIGKTAGYAETYKGLYLVIESTDVTGFIQAGASSGFSTADAWLNNGWMGSYMGVDIYVIKSGTFCDATLGTHGTVTNDGHRVFGVKGITTYCAPRGVQYKEIDVTATTGKEVTVWGYIGFKAWYAKLALTVDITIK